MAAAVMAPYFCHGCVGEKINDVQIRVCRSYRERTLCLNDDLFTTFRV
jgi:hypothetical protein